MVPSIRGIDTSVYGAAAGQILYCDPSTPGGFTITQPTAPNLNIPIAFTVDYKSNGTIAVRAFPGYHLDELHDVYITTPSDKDVLSYDATNQRWEAVSLSAVMTTYTHIQSSAVSTWSINHNLGRYPSVSVVDSAGNKVIGDVEYVDSDNIDITFCASFSGKAYLN